MRRLLKDNRGQVRIIEAFLSSMLILACLTLIPAQIPDRTTSDEVLLSKAQNVLISIDSDGQIGRLVDNHDWATLVDCLESALPLTVWFNMTVYDANYNCLNDYPICSSGAVSNEVVSYSYICASPESSYAVYILQLQMAVVD
jgi:hypothetical protein